MDVQTDHRIVAFGEDRMMLFDANEGVVIVDCTRPDTNSPWTIIVEGLENVSAATRVEAIQTMIDQALASLPGTGYSCIVPHGLSEMP